METYSTKQVARSRPQKPISKWQWSSGQSLEDTVRASSHLRGQPNDFRRIMLFIVQNNNVLI